MMRDPYSWGGPSYPGYAGEMKGSDTTQQAERQQVTFNGQLMQIFQQQFANQKAVLDFIQGRLKPMANNPTGYSPAALNAMRAQATDNLSAQFQDAQRALQQKEFSQGGRDLPSGVNAQLDAGLLAQEAAQKAGAENNITLQNENLKQQNYWAAINALSGNAAQVNPLGYAGAANNGGNAAAGLSEANTQANKSGFLGGLSSSLGAGIGSGISGALFGA